MDALAVAALLQMPTAPRFADANAVDRYYRAHDPGNRRRYLLPFVSTAAMIAVMAFALETGSVAWAMERPPNQNQRKSSSASQVIDEQPAWRLRALLG